MELLGEWSETSSGGCPKHSSWTINPQFILSPTVKNASYTITLRQHAERGSTLLPIGLWLMRADAAARKVEFTSKDMVCKSKFKQSIKQTLTVPLHMRDGGLPYIVCCSTFDPNMFGRFTLSVSSTEDPAVRLMPLQPTPAPLKSKSDEPAHLRLNAMPHIQNAVPADLSANSVSAQQLGRAGANVSADVPKPKPPPPGSFQFSPFPETGGAALQNEPVYRGGGGGLSPEQLAEVRAAMHSALEACARTGGMYEDSSFKADSRALEGERASWHGSERVHKWRRPHEISTAARLFKNDWEVEGVCRGLLHNGWLSSALNVVAGERSLLEALFIDMDVGAQHGLYAVRLFVPNDGDENTAGWRVFFVDDKLPCGADGNPAFARCPSDDIFWVPMLEKALAKHFGSYADTETADSEEATLLAIEMLTGRRASQAGGAAHIVLPLAGGDANAAWDQLNEAHKVSNALAARIDPRHSSSRSASGFGLVPGRAYCVVTSGEIPSCGRMMRMRGFTTDPEWRGKWSDGDAAWTSRLRQLLSYKDSSDGTFWIDFSDFCRHFTSLFVVRVSMPPHFAIESCWDSASAGGAPERAAFRHNNQWLLHVTQPNTRITVELTQLERDQGTLGTTAGTKGTAGTSTGAGPSRLSAAVATAPPLHMGMIVLMGNTASSSDGRRRKLWLGEDELVAHAEPVSMRSLTLELVLQPCKTPYVLVPYTTSIASVSAFSLALIGDENSGGGSAARVPGHAPGDVPGGVAEVSSALPFGVEYVSSATDWHVGAVRSNWSKAQNSADYTALFDNLQATLRLHEATGAAGATTARTFIFVETVGYSGDVPPSIGLLLAEGAGGANPLKQLPADAKLMPSQQRDAVFFEISLPVGACHVLIPYLAEGEAARLGGTFPKMQIWVYSENQLELRALDGEWSCEKCRGPNAKHRQCPYFSAMNKMESIEAIMDQRLAFLDEALAVEQPAAA